MGHICTNSPESIPEISHSGQSDNSRTTYWALHHKKDSETSCEDLRGRDSFRCGTSRSTCSPGLRVFLLHPSGSLNLFIGLSSAACRPADCGTWSLQVRSHDGLQSLLKPPGFTASQLMDPLGVQPDGEENEHCGSSLALIWKWAGATDHMSEVSVSSRDQQDFNGLRHGALRTSSQDWPRPSSLWTEKVENSCYDDKWL